MDSIKVIGKSEFRIISKFPIDGAEFIVEAFDISHAAKQFAIRYFEKHRKAKYIEFDASWPQGGSKSIVHYSSSRSLDGDIKTELMI